MADCARQACEVVDVAAVGGKSKRLSPSIGDEPREQAMDARAVTDTGERRVLASQAEPGRERGEREEARLPGREVARLKDPNRVLAGGHPRIHLGSNGVPPRCE